MLDLETGNHCWVTARLNTQKIDCKICHSFFYKWGIIKWAHQKASQNLSEVFQKYIFECDVSSRCQAIQDGTIIQ